MAKISINKEVLSKYSDEQLSQWAKDNGLSDAELAEVKTSLQETEPASDKKKGK